MKKRNQLKMHSFAFKTNIAFVVSVAMVFINKSSVTMRKIITEIKYIRSKNTISTLSAKEAQKMRIQKLSEKLGCTAHTAREIVSKNKQIMTLDSSHFLQNAKFCSQHLKLSDLIEFPLIMSMNSSLLQHRYYSLTELGCTYVTASNILKFPQLIKKHPEELKDENILFSGNLHSKECLKFLENEYKNKTISKIQQLLKNGCSLLKIREILNAEFLSTRLDCSLSKAHQLFHRYPPLRLQSITNTKQLLDSFEKFGFPLSKVFQLPNLLSLHHENVETFLSEIPEILGIRTLYIASKLPLLLRRPIDSVHKIESILKEFNVTEKQLICCPKVIIFTPNTLQQRLETLCSSEDFAVLKSSRKFLWLVYYYKNLSSRLKALKAFDIPSSISMFTLSKSNFEKYLCISESRTHINDVCFYLSNVLNCNENDVQMKLREYPHFHHSSLQNSRQIVEFLLSSGVSKKQLYNGIGIIFYDANVVKLYFKDLKNHPEMQPFSQWVSHYNLIQLLIYAIEVDTGFRGSRLYKAKARIDDDEPLIASSQVL